MMSDVETDVLVVVFAGVFFLFLLFFVFVGFVGVAIDVGNVVALPFSISVSVSVPRISGVAHVAVVLAVADLWDHVLTLVGEL